MLYILHLDCLILVDIWKKTLSHWKRICYVSCWYVSLVSSFRRLEIALVTLKMIILWDIFRIFFFFVRFFSSFVQVEVLTLVLSETSFLGGKESTRFSMSALALSVFTFSCLKMSLAIFFLVTKVAVFSFSAIAS